MPSRAGPDRKTREAPIPARSPTQTEPEAKATAAEKKAAGEHLALESDVENASPFGPQTGEAGQQQRRGEADGRVEDLEDGQEIHQQASCRVRKGNGWRTAPRICG